MGSISGGGLGGNAAFRVAVSVGIGDGFAGMVEHNVAQGKVEFAQGVVAPFGRQLAFPHHDDVPPHGLQQFLVALVPLAVALNLFLPELGVGRGAPLVAVMPVPEASVHQDDRPPFPHHDVGASRQ